MGVELLYWKEKLSLLKKGKSLPVDNAQSVYSAIRSNPELFKDKEFSIRSIGIIPGQIKKRVIRIK